MVASHPHADHIGGLTEVMQAVPVGQMWTSGAAHTTQTFERFLDTIAEKKIPYHEAAPGDTIPFGTGAFEVLHARRSAADLNDTSLVLRLQYGDVSFLFTGDAEAPSEAEMLRTVRPKLAATVLKVGHHGSYSSSSPEFLAAVRPKVAVYSAGADNSYGHPHEEPIRALKAVGATIYGTDVDGTVVITTDSKQFQVTSSRSASAPSMQVPGAVLHATPTPVATVLSEHLRYDPQGPDRNCGEFATHAEAQAFFLAGGGPQRDRHRLDGDGDGIACESLP